MRKFLFLLIVILLSGCGNEDRFEGTLHPSSSKLHNIQVLLVEPSRKNNDKIYIKYFSFKDSMYHKCYTQAMFIDSFKVGSIRK